MENERLRGEIVNIIKGSYGFIRIRPPGEPRQDFLFRKNDVSGLKMVQLEIGDIVDFTPEPDYRGEGMRAKQIELVCEAHLKSNWRFKYELQR